MQLYPSRVEFKNIRVRDLVPAKAAAPLDPAWLKAVAAMKPVQQVEAVKAELMKRNPGFDGTMTPKVDMAGVVTLEFFTDNVTDIAPCATQWPMRTEGRSCTATSSRTT